jgi:C1A family cysteine protease
VIVDLAPQLHPVCDQGPRGTCAAFATSAVHEHARHRRGRTDPQLCVELLLWRAKQLDGLPGDATTFDAAARALHDDGHCPEVLWPYDVSRDPSVASPTPPTAALAADVARRATMTQLGGGRQPLLETLRDGRCVIIGIELWEGFYACREPALPDPAHDIDPGALHAVCLVGVDDAAGRVKVRNSWGTGWGQNGYAWMPIDALDMVLREAWTVVDDLDDTPDS